MKTDTKYLMESDDESVRLDLKTDSGVVEKQALWAGIRPGMRIADLGCGAGKTTSILNKLVQPGGKVVGIDLSDERLQYAEKNYGCKSIRFEKRDIKNPLTDLEEFDFIWCRFVLEYHQAESFDLVRNMSKILKPGGILCLIDLDHNCLNHHGHSEKFERAMRGIIDGLSKKANFDPFVGRKLYSFLYDLNYDEIQVDVAGHHVIYGELKDADAFNWLKKVEVAPKKINYSFDEYEGGYEEFLQDFNRFFTHPRRFTYSPIISCRGRKSA